jgi:hypothetical protein
MLAMTETGLTMGGAGIVLSFEWDATATPARSLTARSWVSANVGAMARHAALTARLGIRLPYEAYNGDAIVQRRVY